MPDDDASDHASLSEFVADDRQDGGAGDDPDPTAGDDPDPAVSTSDYRPAGADCEACGATAERRWRDDGALVCADCKPW